MSDSSRTQLLTRPEGAWAEAAPLNAATKRQRFTGETLSIKNTTVLSQEIRSDRQRTDMPLVGVDAAGDIHQELIYGAETDEMLQAVLCGTWSTPVAITDGATTSGSPTVTSATAVFTSEDLHKAITGAGIPALSYIGVINSPTSIGLSSSATANTPVNATATATGITFTVASRSTSLRNGVTNRSFGIEAGFLDIAKYIYFPGCIPSKYMLDIAARSLIKVSTSWMGQRGIPSATSIAGSTPPTEPASNAPMKAGPTVSILSAGTQNTEMLGVTCRRITLDITNTLRARDVATSTFAVEPGRNVMEITGTVETYFDEITRLQAFQANGFFAAKVRLTDLGIVSLPNTYEITLPTLKMSDAPVDIPSDSVDIMQIFSFRALLDPAVGYAINIDRNLIV